ncbi:MAG: ChbG/HpnK family deacetylase [Clostridia bacterium]|nr:ChbG/HpnK family deacetylase [Clostridia bacterium]
MVYFCADDYGIAKQCNNRIEKCLDDGVLNKVSVLPNGETENFKLRLEEKGAKISLHLNLVEGYPLSSPQDVPLLITPQGTFKHSFVGLLFLSLSKNRRDFEKQIYKEIQKQLEFWKTNLGDAPLWLDSHQHVHMIPLVFRTLLKALEDEKIKVEYLRIPSEPILPYLLTPSLYLKLRPINLIKQWLLNFLALVNRKALKKSKIPYAYFMGVAFSGFLTKEKIEKLLPKYLKLAQMHNKDVEITLHPGFLEAGESLSIGCRADFEKFYFSSGRKQEFDTLLNLK